MAAPARPVIADGPHSIGTVSPPPTAQLPPLSSATRDDRCSRDQSAPDYDPMIRGRRRICISSPEVDRAPNRQSSAFPVLVAGRTTLEIPPRGPHKQKTFDDPAHLEYCGLRPREERRESGEERFFLGGASRGTGPNLEYGVFRRFPMRLEAALGAQARAPARLDGRPTSDETFLPHYCSCVHIFRTLWAWWARRTSFQTCPTLGHPVCSCVFTIAFSAR